MTDVNQESACPVCGRPMERWPSLEEGSLVSVCIIPHEEPDPNELDELEKDLTLQLFGKPKEETGEPSRFRRLLDVSGEPAGTGDLSLSPYVEAPTRARELLSMQVETAEPVATRTELPEDAAEPRPPTTTDLPELDENTAPDAEPTMNAKSAKLAAPPEPTQETVLPTSTEVVSPPDQAQSAVPFVGEPEPQEEAEVDAPQKVPAILTGPVTPEEIAFLAADAELSLEEGGEHQRCPQCEAIVSARRAVCPWCSTTL